MEDFSVIRFKVNHSTAIIGSIYALEIIFLIIGKTRKVYISTLITTQFEYSRLNK